jgi:DNA invertase Pin-like site-specific DNA recombinase
MTRERTRAGLAAAKEDGRVGGRPRSLNDKQRREIADAVLSGRKSAADMARLFGVSPATISRALAGQLSSAG